MSKTFYVARGKTSRWPHLKSTSSTSLTYDDVLLLPQNSSITSRTEIDTSVTFGPFKLTLPVVSAPMDTIVGEKMVKKLAQLGALGTLPRSPINETLSICRRLSEQNIPAIYAVGLKDALENAKALKKHGAQMILVDVANGGLTAVQEATAAIVKKLKLHAFCGNIATFEQAVAYRKRGIPIARVGIGPGGLCTTRIKTGVGLPQLSAIFETKIPGLTICADGGIRKPGDVAKAIAAGASVVMIGSLFAGTEETPGEVQDGYKLARGQASESYMKDNHTTLDEHRTAEGISTLVKASGSVEHVIRDISGGLKSAMSYSNAQNLKAFQKNALFLIANSPAASREANPHILEA
jgi:IMP dehydrogenase